MKGNENFAAKEKRSSMSKVLFKRLFSLKGKTALIIGGYKGIGRIFAETYAEASAEVVVAARNLEGCRQAAQEISEKYGVKVAGRSIDVRDSDKVDRAVAWVISEFGRIDILVNCAGVPGSQKPVFEMSNSDIDEVMNVDFRGVFLASRAVGRHMVEHKSGRIINVSSLLGKVAARNMSGYCASKAAVIQLTRVMALELVKFNIQVNVLCPGYFLTDFNRKFFNSDAGKNFIQKKIPINRVGDLEELCSTALYLATAPSFLTGAEIYIDGGHGIA